MSWQCRRSAQPEPLSIDRLARSHFLSCFPTLQHLANGSPSFQYCFEYMSNSIGLTLSRSTIPSVIIPSSQYEATISPMNTSWVGKSTVLYSRHSMLTGHSE